MKKSLTILALLVSAVAVHAHGVAAMPLAPMFTPGMTQHLVTFTSSQPGDVVTYGAQQCVMPCQLDVRDQFGWFSTYTFTSSAGGKVEFQEPTIFHAQGIVPIVVHFGGQ